MWLKEEKDIFINTMLQNGVMKIKQLTQTHDGKNPKWIAEVASVKPDEHQTKVKLALGRDYKVIRLDGSMVAPSAKEARKAKYRDGERLFKEMYKIFQGNFPKTEYENFSQFRAYFHDEFSKSWYVKLALNGKNEVIGVRTYSYIDSMDLIMLNITVVRKDYVHCGVSKGIEAEMLDSIRKEHPKVKYAIAEVERPDFENFKGEEGRLRNVVRPGYHDKVSNRRAIRLPSGEPLVYLLPIMATDKERSAAIKEGEPLEPEPLMFCIRTIGGENFEAKSINAKEVARLLVWFYKDYLEKECSDVKPHEVDILLADALAKIAGKSGLKDRIHDKLARSGREELMHFIPSEQLPFMKVSETAIGKPS